MMCNLQFFRSKLRILAVLICTTGTSGGALNLVGSDSKNFFFDNIHSIYMFPSKAPLTTTFAGVLSYAAPLLARA
jgi:hypothetical protein